MKKRLLSIALCLVMALTLLPMSALAATAGDGTTTDTACTTAEQLAAALNKAQASCATASGSTVTMSDSISALAATIYVKPASGITLDLNDKSITGAKGDEGQKGITPLNVVADSAGKLMLTGSGTITGGSGGSQAGTGGSGVDGNVEITGSGTVNLTGGTGGNGVNGNVKITGSGTVNLTGGSGGSVSVSNGGDGGNGVAGNAEITGTGTANLTGGSGGGGSPDGAVGKALTGTLTATGYTIKGGDSADPSTTIDASAANTVRYVTVMPSGTSTNPATTAAELAAALGGSEYAEVDSTTGAVKLKQSISALAATIYVAPGTDGITLDLNGKTITGGTEAADPSYTAGRPGISPLNVVSGTFTIQNSSNSIAGITGGKGGNGQNGGYGGAGGSGISGNVTVSGSGTVNFTGGAGGDSASKKGNTGKALSGTLTAEGFVVKGGSSADPTTVVTSGYNTYQFLTVTPIVYGTSTNPAATAAELAAALGGSEYAEASGGTVKLLKNVSLTDTLYVAPKDGVTLKLNLNGFTITGASGKTAIEHKGTGELRVEDQSTACDGEIKGVGAPALVNSSTGTITTTRGTITSTSGAAIRNTYTGTVRVGEGGVFGSGEVAVENIGSGNIKVQHTASVRGIEIGKGTLKDYNDNDVTLYTFTLDGVAPNTAVNYISVKGDNNFSDSGNGHFKTDADGKIYIWSSKTLATAYAKAGDIEYASNGPITGNAATLKRVYEITWDYSPVNGSYDAAIAGKDDGYSVEGAAVAITPTPDSGYELDKITVVNTGETGTDVPVKNNTFTMPDYAVTVTVTFKQITSGNTTGDYTPPTVTVPVSSDAGKASVSATVSGGTASVSVTDKQLESVIDSAGQTGTVSVDVSGVSNINAANIPAKVVKATAESDTATGLQVSLPTGAVKLDSAAVKAVNGGKDVTVSVENVKTSDLTSTQKQTLGDKLDSAVVVDVSVLVNGVKQTGFNGGKITVSMPYTPKAGEDTSKLTVWYIKDDGSIENVGGYYDAANKCFVFTTSHLSQYVLVSDAGANPFTDVKAGDYYYDAVLWAAKNEITSGTDATHFAPNGFCTRAQAVAFLWRASGSPEPTATVNPFTDVSKDAYYYKAVLWAVEKGITKGTSATAFSPDDTCTRAQIVSFQYRAALSPATGTVNPFTDVANNAYYASAVKWAAEKSVTEGTTTTTFSPNAGCTRGQIAVFLFRQLGK